VLYTNSTYPGVLHNTRVALLKAYVHCLKHFISAGNQTPKSFQGHSPREYRGCPKGVINIVHGPTRGMSYLSLPYASS